MIPRTRSLAACSMLMISVLLCGADALAADSIVGTWKLVRFVNVVDGEEQHPFGREPRGYFTYTAEGVLMIQIQHETPPTTWKSLDGAFSGNTPWYVGYFGRFSVRPDEGVVVHEVEGGTVLRYIGTDQPRPFTLDGNRLVIGEPGAWERELIRVE